MSAVSKVGALVAAMVLMSLGLGGISTADTPSWPMGGHDLDNSRNNPTQAKVGAANANRLGVKWTYTTHGDVSATPAVVGNSVYFPDWGGYLHKVNATTGVAEWTVNLATLPGEPANALSRTAPAVSDGVVYIGDQSGGGFPFQPARLMAFNANTGTLRWSTELDPHVFSIITQAPGVYNGVVFVGVASAEENNAAFIPGYVCCNFRGSMMAVRAATGEILWKTYMVPTGYSGGAVWGSTPAVQAATNTVYISTGNNYSVPESVKQCQQNGGSASQCLSPDDHIDAIVALDMTSGAIKWATGVQGFDDWIVSCIPIPGVNPNCPTNPGPDFDFGSGPNLFTVSTPSGPRLYVGAGAKSGIYWALDATTGQVKWSTQAGPGSTLGGIEWGTATDGKRIYVAEANYDRLEYPGRPSLPHYGSFAALDPATGAILWQTPDPSGGADLGAVSVSNGVVYGGSLTGHMNAFNAESGQVLWDYLGQGASNAGPAIANNGSVYWGNGYGRFGLGAPSTTFYAFSLEGK
jgi:polyvinyl alcohol dehydrogenase (cytochrome)